MFNCLIAILTSVIGAVYYLNIIKETFFYKPESKINPILESSVIHGVVYNINNVYIKSIVFSYKNIVLSSSTTIVVSVLTLIVLLFMLINNE